MNILVYFLIGEIGKIPSCSVDYNSSVSSSVLDTYPLLSAIFCCSVTANIPYSCVSEFSIALFGCELLVSLADFSDVSSPRRFSLSPLG